MAEGRRADWRTAVVIGGSLLLLGYFITTLEWDEVWRALAGVHPGWVAAGGACVVADYYARAMRWAVVVHHFDPLAPRRDFWRAMTIGNALNTILPLRAGDVLRPMFLAAKRQLPLPTVLSTVVVERLLDAIGVIVTLGLVVLLLDRDVATASLAFDQVREWGLPAVITASVLLVSVLMLASRRARFAAKAGLSWLGQRWRRRGYRLYLQLVEGLQPARVPRRFGLGMFWTGAVWVFTVLSIVSVMMALQIKLPLVGAMFIAVALTVAITLPQAPGYLGLFQVAMTEALVLWGATRGESQAAALVLWAVYVLPITAIGIVHAWLEAAEVSAIRARLTGGPSSSE